MAPCILIVSMNSGASVATFVSGMLWVQSAQGGGMVTDSNVILSESGGIEMSIDLEVLRNLPIEEKLRLVELLWDDIGASGEPIPLHSWQVAEAGRRSAELKSDPSIAINRDELWRLVDG